MICVGLGMRMTGGCGCSCGSCVDASLCVCVCVCDLCRGVYSGARYVLLCPVQEPLKLILIYSMAMLLFPLLRYIVILLFFDEMR